MKTASKFRFWLRHKRIAFDTSFLIPILEDMSLKGNQFTRILQLSERKSVTLITSAVTLLEVLVHPYRAKDFEAVDRYYGYLTQQSLLRILPLTADIADYAANLRARYGFKTPDAIQIATALKDKATLFLTQDHCFRKQKEIEIGFL